MLAAFLESTNPGPKAFDPSLLSFLKKFVELTTLFYCISAEHHHFFDTSASNSICSKDWLEKVSWGPQKKINLASFAPPFRLARHPLCALHSAGLSASTLEITGKTHALKLFAWVLPPKPIPFYIGFSDQRSLGFDTCLRDRSPSDLRVSM